MTPKSPNSQRSALLCGVFFLSGASALIFETLWFRQAGLAFGNSVWASALVLSAFMAGLALGNGLAARVGHRVRRPERLYAGVELVVAVVGILLVVGLPLLTELMAPVFRSLVGHPLVLNGLRLSISFLLLMVPATAMGMTLPLLVKALIGSEDDFGRALGQLYGWNTLGAVAGALLGETLLIEAFGIVGTSAWAGTFNLVAAVGALHAARSVGPQRAARHATPRPALTRRARRILFASFLSGGILLALEVVWFRFLQLFVPGTTLTFAVMLAIVLGGIGLGGLVAARLFREFPEVHGRACAVALAMGITSILAYTFFGVPVGDRTEIRLSAGYGLESLGLCSFLMFPVAFLSGILFALTGKAAHQELREETRAVGLVTMANTLGATLGPLVAGFLLIPSIGMERSFFVLALLYALVGLLLAKGERWRAPTLSGFEYGLAFVLALSLAFFPHGHMERYISLASAAHRTDGSKVVAVREGLTETLQYLRKDYREKPLSHRLVTNGFSMSGTYATARRYMKYYVYWPVAVHPAPRKALLISFGTGSTAKALTDTSALESIVVVDISREILEMSDVVFPEEGENPLDDPRVEVHVEDGRFFLQTTEQRFDVITSEPPPPKIAGVVSLYTQEYFQLIHDRLADGGVTTYWLPVGQLLDEETNAVLRAFVNVFGDEASLWTGCGLDWMLVGTRNGAGPVDAEHFARQWQDPVVGPEMRALGFEDPAQIGSTFLMGAEDLRSLTARTEPLTDDRPKRLSSRLGTDVESITSYARTMDPVATRRRFAESPYVSAVWPRSLRERSAAFFPAQEILNRITVPSFSSGDLDFALLHYLLEETSLRTPILWACGSSAAAEEILAASSPEAGDEVDGRTAYDLAVTAMADRDYARAEQLMARSCREKPSRQLDLTRIYLLCMDRRHDEARALMARNEDWYREHPDGVRFVKWLEKAVGFEQWPRTARR